MADGDWLDPFASTQPDVGSTTGIGNTLYNPNDPLNDWASNLTPDALNALKNQYATDPSGAIQTMIDQGHPPPDHHYTTDANGNLQPVSSSDAAALDAAKARLAQGLTGQQQGSQTPPVQTAQSQLNQPIRMDPSGRLYRNITSPSDQTGTAQAAAGVYPGGTTGEGQLTPPSPNQPPGQVYVPGRGTVPRGTLPTPPPATTDATAPPSTWQWPKSFWPTPEQTDALQKSGQTGDLLNPPPARPATTPPQTKPDVAPTPAAVTPDKSKPAYVPDNTPPPIQPTPAGKKKKAEKDDEDEDKPFGPKALEGFSKSLAGVKVPERKPLPPPSAAGVRAPVSVQQTLAGLLTAAGAHAPQTAPPTGLIRLLKGY